MKMQKMSNCLLIQIIQGGPKVTSRRFELIASEHMIRKIFSGVCRDSHWFDEYRKIIEIDDNFLSGGSFFAFFIPLTCLDHILFGLLLFGPSRYEYTVKIRALACPVLEIYRVIDCAHHSLPGVQ